MAIREPRLGRDTHQRLTPLRVMVDSLRVGTRAHEAIDGHQLGELARRNLTECSEISRLPRRGQTELMMDEPVSQTETRPARRYLATFGLENDVPVDEVLAWLSQAVLAEGPASGMTIDEVSAGLERETGLAVDRNEIRRSIASTAKNEVTITDHEPPVCIISPAARESALVRVSEAERTEKTIIEEWATHLSADPRAPVGTTVKFIADDFRYFCENVALMHGADTVALVYGEREQATQFLERLDTETWSAIPERVQGYREFCRSGFPEFFLEASGPRAVFTANLLDRTLELCRLNIAPRAQRLLVKQLANTALYLDTNVLFCLLGLHGPAAHLDTRRVLDLGRLAKVRARVTPRTLTEFRGAALTLQREHPGRYFPPEALIGLDPQLRDREFFSEYRKLFHLAQMPGGDFGASMNHLERTLGKFGVEVWLEKTNEVEKQGDRFESLAQELHDQYQAREDRRHPEQHRLLQPEKARHDAYHIVLVELLRPPSAKSFADVKTWFTTHHYSLAHKAITRAKGGVPAVIMFEQWHQLLRSVLPRSQDFDETFVRGMQCPLFRAHRGNYFTAAQTLAARLAAYKNIDDEHFARIITDASFARKVALIEEKSGKIDDSDLAPLIDERLASELRTETDRRKEIDERARRETARAQQAEADAAAKTAELDDEKRRSGEASTQARQLARQVADLQKELQRRDAEDTRRVAARVARRARWSTFTRLFGALVFLALAVTACRIRPEGLVVLGTTVSVLALAIGLAGVAGALVFWRHNRVLTVLAIVVPILISILQVGVPSPTKGGQSDGGVVTGATR